MRRHLSVLTLAVLLVAALGLPAQAHSGLVSIVPANGTQVGAVPKAVTLTFNEPIESDGTSVVVTGPDGAVVSTGPTSIKGAVVQQALSPTSSAGRYTVSYRITSEDGHPVTSTRTFSLKAGAAAAAAPAAAPVEAAAVAPASTAADGGSTLLIAVLALVALALVGGVGAVAVRKRTAS